MSISLELEKFCDWFEGEFDNWTQAASNPTKWAHIIVTHKKIGDRKFDTSSRYSYQSQPYRQQVVEVTEPEIVGANVPIIIVKNPACDMIFSYDKDDDCFIGASEQNCTFKEFQSIRGRNENKRIESSGNGRGVENVGRG